MNTEITPGTLLVAEYERLKEEQNTRIGFRDNLLYASLGSMAAVIAAVLQSPGRPYLLLLLPPVSVVLGWTYLVNDEKVSAISRYIREELIPSLLAMTRSEVPVFGWEFAHRADVRRRSRKLLQLAVDLATFCASPLAAIVVVWAAGVTDVWVVAVSVIELVAVGVLGAQIIIYADLQVHRHASGDDGSATTVSPATGAADGEARQSCRSRTRSEVEEATGNSFPV
ncbi:hypothetical protein ACI2K4_06685 [Micromonospora sp. NPDC050397]|uniref:hypothetical protein n=1 Tax=Micromonospora sp. NPDC050397 TaxID=3364279 RepID=UPI00384E856D